MACLQLDEAQARTLHEMGIPSSASQRAPTGAGTAATGARRDARHRLGSLRCAFEQCRELGALVAPAWSGGSVPANVPAVALAAIVAPDLLVADGSVSLAWTNIKLIAGLSAIAFFLWTRNVLATLVFGMVVFTVLRLVG